MSELHAVLERVMRHAGSRLAAYGFVLTGSQSDAEELVQEAIVKTFVRRPRLADPASAEQYVRLAMKTLTIDRARKEARFRREAPTQVHTAELPDIVHAISTRVAVQDALRGLTSQQRVAIALRYWDDLTVPEIANQMKVRPGTVKRYLHDASAALRPLLGEHDDDGEDSLRVVTARGGAR